MSKEPITKQNKVTLLKGAKAAIEGKQIALVDLIAMITIFVTIGISSLTGIYYIGGLNSDVRANVHGIDNLEKSHDSFKQTYISHTRIVDDSFTNLQKDVSEIKGSLRVLLERTEDTKK